jgi:hypothetical protein
MKPSLGRSAALCLATSLAAQPLPAQELRPYQAQEVRPTRAKEVQPSAAPRAEGRQDASFFFRTFGLAVPGGAYSWDNLATQTRTHVVSAGALTKSSLRINADGTYDWNSAWEGRLLRGRWALHKDGLLLRQGQEGKDWVLGRLAHPSGRAEVYLFDRNAMTYHGTPRPDPR